MDSGIHARGLAKQYGRQQAVRGVDLDVPAGSVTAVLGPNGAGKTTLVRMLATLLDPDAGQAFVAGFDIRTNPREVRRRIGLTGQYVALDDRLTGRENLRLIARLHHLARSAGRERAETMLGAFGLQDAAGRVVRTYSGGMRRRLDLAASLLADPLVLFLDEPTTGLDPASREDLWQTIRSQVARGVTVLLTTQYLQEADELADRVLVVDGGLVIAEGTPDELKRTVGGERLHVALASRSDALLAAAVLHRFALEPPALTEDGVGVQVILPPGMAAIADSAKALQHSGLDVISFGLTRPDLDEVFFSLTGHSRAAETSDPAGTGGPAPTDRSTPADRPAERPAAEEPAVAGHGHHRAELEAVGR